MLFYSGAADVGEIGDRAIRLLHKAGDAKMFGFAGFLHLRVSDLGLDKGNTPVTYERIEVVVEKMRAPDQSVEA